MPTVSYTTFNGVIVSENRAGVKRDYMRDSLGSTIALLDSTQTQTDTFFYWPYGEIRTSTGTTKTPFTFVGTLGYYMDIASSLFYVRMRHLRTTLARWLTVDALWPGQPRFAYGHWDPVDLSDATGLAAGASGGSGAKCVPTCPDTDKTYEACIALYCAIKTARAMMCDISDAVKCDAKVEDALKEVQACLSKKRKKGDPDPVQQCIKDVADQKCPAFTWDGISNCIARAACAYATSGGKHYIGWCKDHYSDSEQCNSCCGDVFIINSANYCNCQAL